MKKQLDRPYVVSVELELKINLFLPGFANSKAPGNEHSTHVLLINSFLFSKPIKIAPYFKALVPLKKNLQPFLLPIT